MNLVKALFYLIVYLFISIGDVLLKIVKALIWPYRVVGSKRSKHTSSEKILYRSKRHKEKKSETFYVRFRQLFETLLKYLTKLLSFIVLGAQNTSALTYRFLAVIFYGVSFLGFHTWLFVRKLIKLLAFLINYPQVIIKSFFQAKKQRGKRIKKKLFSMFFLKTRYFVLGLLVSFVFFFLPLLGFIMLYDLPNPASLSTNYIPKTSKIYDRNGVLLYELYASQNRTLVRLKDVPKNLINATISIEDKDFYSHPGFDLRGILRAFISNIQGKELQGGSTITQQLIKSALLTSSPNIIRKIKEVTLSFWAERMYSKDQILELYFNYVPYGGTAWGVEAAADVYFGKKVSELTLSEAAYLAGLPRAPSVYSPYSSETKVWKKRQKEVLDAMARDGFISGADLEKAYQQELVFQSPVTPIKAPHFVMYVKDLLVRQFGLSEVEKGGLIVKTSLDLDLQEEIETIVAEEVASNSYLNIQNGAAVITDPKTGDVLAMVGSKNYFDREIDGNVNITTSKRQPGSTIKVVTYALALTSGYTEASILDDSPVSIPDGDKVYAPVNYDGKFHGKLPLRLAFANSLNIPAVRVAQKLGVENIVNFGRDMGITSWGDPKKYGVSITLGGGEVTMLDLASAYGTIANQGQKVDINPILEIQDYSGRQLFIKEANSSQVVDPGIAYIISDILSDNRARSMEFGLSSPLNIAGHRVSVKTGTTDNKRDNWTIGFNDDYLVASWVGNNNNTPMSPNLTSGITGAAPIWNKIITRLLENYKDPNNQVPDNLVKKSCYGFEMYFIRGTENNSGCNASPISNFPVISITPIITSTPGPNQPLRLSRNNRQNRHRGQN